MSENRYRYDTGSIIDQRKNEVLSIKQAVNRLNRQDVYKRNCKSRVNAMVKSLNYEIENADSPELKQALIRIANKELEEE